MIRELAASDARRVSVRAQELVEICRQVADRASKTDEHWPFATVAPRSERRDLQAQSGGSISLGQRFDERRRPTRYRALSAMGIIVMSSGCVS